VHVQDFDSPQSATSVIESHARKDLEILGRSVQMEYSVAPQPAHATSNSALVSTLDWICTMCQAVNFCRCVACHAPGFSWRA
jgi:hypothetical protein